jgi:hypothetical protein
MPTFEHVELLTSQNPPIESRPAFVRFFCKADRKFYMVDELGVETLIAPFTSSSFLIIDGTVAAPGLAFIADTNTGLWRPGSGIVGVAGDGLEVVRFQAPGGATPQVLSADGTAADPAYSFALRDDTGMYHAGGGLLSFSSQGVVRLQIGTGAVLSYLRLQPSATNTLDLGTSGGVWKDVYATRMLGGAGAVGSPTYSFEGDPNTGFYNSTTDTIAVSLGGTQTHAFQGADLFFQVANGGISAGIIDAYTKAVGAIQTGNNEAVRHSNLFTFTGAAGALQKNTAIRSTINQTLTASFTDLLLVRTETATGTGAQRFIEMLGGAGGATTRAYINNAGEYAAGDGAVGAPAFTFVSDPNTGFYLSSADVVSVSGGGTAIARFSAPGGASPQILAQNGTPSTPPYSFIGEPTTGIYHVAPEMSFVVLGVEIARLQASGGTEPQFLVTDGSVVEPSFGFVNDPNTGIYRSAASEVAIASDGLQVARFVAPIGVNPQILAADGSATLPIYSFSTAADTGMYLLGGALRFSVAGATEILISNTEIAMFEQVVGLTGGAATPSYTFSGDTNTGMYQSAADVIGFSGGGAALVTMGATAMTVSSDQILVENGAATTPSYSFTNDSNTGLYYLGIADTLGITTGGSVRVIIDTAKMQSNVIYWAPSGSAAAPSYTFTSSDTTGLFLGSNSLGMTVNGTQRALITNDGTGGTISFNSFGSVSNPSVGWISDVSSGIYNPVDNSVGFCGGGAAIGYFVCAGAAAEASRLFMQNGNPTATGTVVANSLYEKNIVKCWAKVTSDAAGAVTINDGFNLTSATITGNNILITMNIDLSSSSYAVGVSCMDGVNDTAIVTSEAAGTFQIAVFDADSGVQATLGTVAKQVSFIVCGAQT